MSSQGLAVLSRAEQGLAEIRWAYQGLAGTSMA